MTFVRIDGLEESLPFGRTAELPGYDVLDDLPILGREHVGHSLGPLVVELLRLMHDSREHRAWTALGWRRGLEEIVDRVMLVSPAAAFAQRDINAAVSAIVG